MDNQYLREGLSILVILLTLFFYMIININFFTGSLQQQNLSLLEDKQSAENRMLTSNSDNREEVQDEIEKKVEVDQLAKIEPSAVASITDIAEREFLVNSTDPEERGENPSIVIR